jgi:serine-type D-Ala-D-Ala carboxypeptidase (penicillin-binding protein 5/6)
MKKVICFFICVCFMMQSVVVFAEGNTDLGLNAKSAILMEESTGNILYESNPDERLPIASVTKVMTMLLIMEAVDSGKISLDDMVTVSENAMSYGGSTMFLETGEQLTVNDMLKGIAVASANDGCVAMAEHLAGSESAFVDMMNEKAKELGMENTHFMNTNGLDEDDHYSSARDVAIMSRELMKHETIFNYTSIWMDTLRGGKFQLANTNKLIRFYDGANGLKTGSTSKALCCLSAAAKRNDMQLIAVVLGAPTSAERFASAKSLLDYGFANYEVNTQITAGDEVQKIAVEKGVDKEVGVVAGDSCSTLVKKGQEDNITKEIKIDETITAPIEAGQKIGTMTISRDGEVIADIDLNASSAVEKKGIGLIIKDFFTTIFFGSNNDTEENSEI